MIENLLNHLGAGPDLALVVDFKVKIIFTNKFPALQLQIFSIGFSVEKRMVLTVEKRSLRTVSEPS